MCKGPGAGGAILPCLRGWKEADVEVYRVGRGGAGWGQTDGTRSPLHTLLHTEVRR